MDSPVVDEVVLGARYRLHSLLGTGGMAQVYDGWDERLVRPVAVKLLRPDLAAIPDLRRRFELEARAAARLTHPNVVSIFDAGEDNGRSFIVMERLPGATLADSIGRGPVELAWLRRVAGEVLAALGAAHDAGIVHRDIKPANILLGYDGRAKVADFGIARVVEPLGVGETAVGETATAAAAMTGAGLVVGTPAYLAPERAMGQPATPQSDLYSLGVVMYEALTGTKPYAGATPAAIAAATVQGVAQNPSRLRPDADPELVAVIGRAMALDPAHRYPSAAAMAADLRRSAPPPTAVMPVAAFAPTIAAVAAAPTVGSGPTAGAGPIAAGRASGGVPPPIMPGRRRRVPSVVAGRRGFVALGVAAIAVALLALVLTTPGSPSRASSSTTLPQVGTTSPPASAATSPATSLPSATTAPPSTAPTVGVNGTDPTALALQAIAKQVARSRSEAAAALARGLQAVAAITDPSARVAAASALLDQTIGWYQQGQLTVGEYATAAAVLHLAGAPQAPPPTVKRGNGNSGGGGGGGG